MQLYDVKCPICGTINHNLYLEETDGWMECEHCQQTVKVLPFAMDKKVPSKWWPASLLRTEMDGGRYKGVAADEA